MSDASTLAFGKFIPGFDFLQKLTSAGPAAGGAVPGLGSWVAPTVSVEELDKRITELKAVLFWLDQNATALKATIQALEVQKMTLAALAGMNLSMAEVAKAFTLPTAEAPAAPAPAAAAAAQGWPFGDAAIAEAAPEREPAAPEPPAAAEPEPEAEPEPTAKPARKRASAKTASAKSAAAPAAGLADPMQWWGALTQQFQKIAASALHDAARAAPAAQTDDASGAAEPKATSRKPTAKKRAAKKAPAKTAKKATAGSAKKAAPRRAASAKAEPAPKADSGWPLPPPFKFGR